jgi:hypothetical protein
MGMNTNLPLYRIVINENTEQGLDFISLVDEPAIIEKGLYFAKHQVFVRPNAGESENDFISRCIPVVIEEGKDQDQAAAICYSYWEDKDTFDSITDYPQGIKDTAQRALNYVQENGWGSCGTPVGKQRANQLAKGEAISEDTIKRMYSFLSRHKGGGADKGEYGDGCGKLMYDAWGGDAALSWSERYLNSLQFKLNKFEFKKTKDKQIVVGPAMIPDLPIYRFDKEMGEYNVVFDAETIDKLVEKFAKTNKEYKINVDHDSIVPSAFIKSSWIIEDEDNDKSKVYGFSLPKGTWMVEIKVEDEEFWNKEVKNNEKFGMSVEGLFELELVNNNKLNKKEKMKLEDFKLALAELTPEEVAELTAAIAEVAPAEVVEEVAEAVVETVNDLMPEEVAEEMAEEEKEEMAVETYTKEEVDAKFEELMAAIAEVKSMMESAPEEANANEFSLQDNRLSFLKMYRSKL